MGALALLLALQPTQGASYRKAQTAPVQPNDNNALIPQHVVTELLEFEQRKRDDKMHDLRRRMQYKIIQLRAHLETVSTKLRHTKEELEDNLLRVEEASQRKLNATPPSSSVWKLAFGVLFLMLLALAVAGQYWYSKAMGKTGKQVW